MIKTDHLSFAILQWFFVPTVNPDKQDFSGDAGDDPLYSRYWSIVGLNMANGKNYSLGTFPTAGKNIVGVESKDLVSRRQTS